MSRFPKHELILSDLYATELAMEIFPDLDQDDTPLVEGVVEYEEPETNEPLTWDDLEVSLKIGDGAWEDVTGKIPGKEEDNILEKVNNDWESLKSDGFMDD